MFWTSNWKECLLQVIAISDSELDKVTKKRFLLGRLNLYQIIQMLTNLHRHVELRNNNGDIYKACSYVLYTLTAIHTFISRTWSFYICRYSFLISTQTVPMTLDCTCSGYNHLQHKWIIVHWLPGTQFNGMGVVKYLTRGTNCPEQVRPTSNFSLPSDNHRDSKPRPQDYQTGHIGTTVPHLNNIQT